MALNGSSTTHQIVSVASAETIRGVLNASHRNTPDFSVIVPAALAS